MPATTTEPSSSFGGASSAYGYSYRARTKTSWAGIGPADAFKSNLDYYTRLPAQRLAYRVIGAAQRAAAQVAQGDSSDFQPQIKPQLGPCYSTYPASIAFYATVGLTAFLEFSNRISGDCLLTAMSEYLQNPAEADDVAVAPEIYRQTAHLVAKTVQTRLFHEDLCRYPSLTAVDTYRLFAASQQDRRFRSLKEILESVILFGDVAPVFETQKLHEQTRELLATISDASSVYLDLLPLVDSEDLVGLGDEWTRSVCYSLAPYLEAARPQPSTRGKPTVTLESPGSRDRTQQAANGTRFDERTQVPPLNDPTAPSLFDPPTAIQRLADPLLGAASQTDSQATKLMAEAMKAAAGAFDAASGQSGNTEDVRSDLLDQTMQSRAFMPTPIEGSPTDGHDVAFRDHDGNEAAGEVFDRPVELSDDGAAYDQLMAEAQPTTRMLKRLIMPNIEQQARRQRLRSAGMLDATRLALVEFSEVVYQRVQVEEVSDRRGRPVLLIACDGSGSLNRNQMAMTKVLACSWLNATASSGIQVLAGLYHSGMVRQGLSGKLVQWMYHPQKTPATSRREAARALVSLPDTGTGVQADALSISFMLDEATRIARGRMVYLVLITDTEWNVSFHCGLNGADEVRKVLTDARDQRPGRLHTTLVGVGVKRAIDFDNDVDHVISVTSQELADYEGVAQKVGRYVAEAMRANLRRVARER